MIIKFSPDSQNDLRKIKQKDKHLYARIEKQIKLLSENPKHPSLRIHKLTGKLNQSWSLSVTKSIRIVYVVLEKNSIYIAAIGTHDQVYRK